MNHEKTVIYHNPRCSKSRETLQIIEDNQVDAEVVRYLDEPPDAAELKRIVGLLGIPARELLRTGEAAYQDAGLDDNSSDDDVIQAICDQPILLERPIVVRGNRAVIGRPPSKVLDLIA